MSDEIKKVPTEGNGGALSNEITVNSNDTAPVADVQGVIAGRLTDEHLQELRSSAISDEVIAECGVYSATEPSQLPEPLKWIAQRPDTLPALVYPFDEPGKGTTWQVKPQPGSIRKNNGEGNGKDKVLKYVMPSKEQHFGPTFCPRRPINGETKRVLVVEGTKQALAVVSATDEETAVYCIPGIQSWMGGESGPSAALQVVDGYDTYICPDADAASNRQVYDASEKLGSTLEGWGARTVRFVRVPGFGKQGIDDVLAQVADASDRPRRVQLWLDKAEKRPASKRPALTNKDRQARSLERLKQEAEEDNLAVVTSDMLPTQVRSIVQQQLLDNFAGRSLFRRSGELVELVQLDSGEVVAQPVSRSGLRDRVDEVVRVVHTSANGGGAQVRSFDVQEADIMLTAARVSRFPVLSGIISAPVMTKGGRFILQDGYDKESGLYLDLAPELRGMSLPSRTPSVDQVQQAREFLEDAFCDFPFEKPSDLTRALGLLLTHLVRPAVGRAPMFLVGANVAGAGKGKLVETVTTIVRGQPVQTKRFPDEETEVDKVVVSQLRAGETHLVFDEVRSLSSAVLCMLLTTQSYQGRILGRSEVASFENMLTVVALGNNPEVSGDLGRRTIPLMLESPYSHPEDRTDFKHPDGWVKDNRRELLAAAYTLILGWLGAGSPAPSTPQAGVGSFESWYRIVGGILEFAGRGDLLEGVTARRRNNNVAENAEKAFLTWVYDEMGEEPFKAFQLVDAAAQVETAGGEVPLPLSKEIAGLTAQQINARQMSMCLREMVNRVHDDGCPTVREAGKHNHTVLYRLEPNDGNNGGPGGSGGPGPTPPTAPVDPVQAPKQTQPVDADQTAHVQETKDEAADSRQVVTFDLETDDAEKLHISGPEFVRLAGYRVNDGPVHLTEDIAGELIPVLKSADLIVGHNVIQFDLAALERGFGLDVEGLLKEGKVVDTLVAARLAWPKKNPGDKHDLSAVAARCGVDGKLVSEGESVLKKLKRKYGGYGLIPVDNKEYRYYTIQDVRATSDVWPVAWSKALEAVGEEYLRYELEVSRLLSRVEAQGVAVDEDEVQRQLDELTNQRRSVRTWLEETVGVVDKGDAPWLTDEGKAALDKYVRDCGARLPRTDKGNLSISKDAFASLAQQYPSNKALVELADKMKLLLETSPAQQVHKANHDGRVYPSISAGQATGRLSTKGPALNVFGSRGKRLLEQRKMIVPDDSSQSLVSVDLSGIDARCMAAGSGDTEYAKLFARGADVHTETAKRLFGDAGRRSDAKVVNHGINYGMGARRLAKNLGTSERQATGYLTAFNRDFYQLAEFKRGLEKDVVLNECVRNGFGRVVGVARTDAKTKAAAFYGQSTARDVFLKGVLSLPREVQDMIRIFVHDEIVLSVPTERTEEIKQLVLDAFESVELPTAGEVSVPVFADAAGPGSDWSQCK